MEHVQEIDGRAEADGRWLVATAFETATAGDGLAGSGMAGAELLRRVRRRTARQRRTRALAPAGAVAALAGAAAVAVTLTATVASAPSAFAAVSAEAAKTSAESFRVTMHGTSNELGPTSHWEATGAFAPSRGVGEEVTDSGETTDLYVGKHVYEKTQSQSAAAGRPWVEYKVWPMTATAIATSPQFAGEEAADPGVLFGLLKSAGTVTDEGPASGPGWTGAKYGFTVAASKDVQVTGTVDVDGKGQVRRMLETCTVAVGHGQHFTFTEDVTFSGFNVPVTVTVPPASQVFVFNGYLGDANSAW